MEWVARTTKSKPPMPFARIGPFHLSLVAVAIAAIATAVVLVVAHAHRTDTASRPAESSIPGPPHAAAPAPNAVLDAAIARGDVRAARDEWRDAHRSAMRSREWRRMAALGDAALEIARLDGTPHSGDMDARRAYLAALFRARAAGSIDGVLRMTESFARLGDRDVADEGLRIADTMVTRTSDARARDRVQALRLGLHGAPSPPNESGPATSTTWDQGP